MSESAYYAHIFFSGHVQGVGFRYQTLQIAKGFEVSGYVRNLSDGRVELEAEGEQSEVKAFVAEVQRSLGDYIRGTDEDYDLRERQFRGFTIR